MKIAHLNPAYHGGAGEAARRLHFGLLERGVDSVFFNLQESRPEEKIVQLARPPSLASRWRAFLIERERSFVRRHLDPEFDSFSDDRTSFVPDLGEALADYDLIHIHGSSFLVDYRRSLSAFGKREQRLVWTLHDMNAFTGGCHYDRDCGRFRRSCGQCPALRSRREADPSRSVWRRKAAGLRKLDPEKTRIVCPSSWLAGLARESSLFSRFEVATIPNSLPIAAAAAPDRAGARRQLGLPAEARIVLFVASSLDVKRKGFHLLEKALSGIASLPGLFLAAVGETNRSSGPGFPHHFFGQVSNPEQMRQLYLAADLLAVPSLQDNLPNTVLEAMAAGLPVVGFDCGGIPEMIRQGMTGFTVPVGDVPALAARIEALLGDEATLRRLGAEGRRIAEAEYDDRLQADRYFKLYETLLSTSTAPPTR